jgi:hypothetical protein
MKSYTADAKALNVRFLVTIALTSACRNGVRGEQM